MVTRIRGGEVGQEAEIRIKNILTDLETETGVATMIESADIIIHADSAHARLLAVVVEGEIPLPKIPTAQGGIAADLQKDGHMIGVDPHQA
jgi:hypothetical protein